MNWIRKKGRYAEVYFPGPSIGPSSVCIYPEEFV